MAIERDFSILNVNKPAGLTSRDVVNRIERLVRPTRAGHAGTLDPLATGVLVVCLGRATRLVEYIQRYPKRYCAEFRLGCTSDTEDIEGTVVELPNACRPEFSALGAALERFLGTIAQVPPAYSAIKVSGERAYAKARRGETVALAPRSVEIYGLQLLSYEYPTLTLQIDCGSGTYVRSLGRDLAREVGTEAVMSRLKRTAIGPYRIEEAVALDALSAETLEDHLLRPETAMGLLPTVVLEREEVIRVVRGGRIRASQGKLSAQATDGGDFAGLDEAGQLVAILRAEGDRWRPVRVFSR